MFIIEGFFKSNNSSVGYVLLIEGKLAFQVPSHPIPNVPGLIGRFNTFASREEAQAAIDSFGAEAEPYTFQIYELVFRVE